MPRVIGDGPMIYWRIHVPAPANWALWAIEVPGTPGILNVIDFWGQSSAQSLPIVGSVQATLERQYGLGVLAGKSKLGVGEYHPRIWRRFATPHPDKTFPREYTLSVQAARNLFVDMREVFRTVEPAPTNVDAYGHKIRDLLMLACTEVESACKRVLLANSYTSPRGARMTTEDYVELLAPFRLNEWELRLSMHHDFPAFKPFGTWSRSNPTGSLDWYDRYNAAKHGRETDIHKATLSALVHALGAVFVLVSAQFGPFLRAVDADEFEDNGQGYNPPWADDFAMDRPTWAMEEFYIPPSFAGQANTGKWTPKTLW